ncbi:MAG: FAD-binding protein, partial [Deltaproteobacteria bacterium]|nr:FAD-binding protein [Deltaproteobacteria bacterium]
MIGFTRRKFIKVLGQGSAILGLGLSSRRPWAQETDSRPTPKKLETDIAVIGAGPGGLSAALRAAELGLTVCVFEKADKTGGARNGGMGPFGAGTHIQAKYGVKNCTTRDAFNYLMDFNHWNIDARLASEYINTTAFTVKWLEDQGVLFGPINDSSEGVRTRYLHAFAQHPDYEDQFYACTLLTDRTKADKNTRLFLETPVKSLLKTGDAVTGLIAVDKSGNELEVRAKAVIITTGGFMGSPEMIKKYTSYTYKKDLFFTYEMPNMSGDGIRMAWEAGAAQSEMMMDVYKGMPIYGGPEGVRMDWAILARPNLMVNLAGERVMNEACADRHFMANAIHRQPGGCSFLMFDSTIADIYRAQTSGGGVLPPGFAAPVNDIDKIVAEAKKLGYPYLFAAESLEDLCMQTGIDLDNLKKTIAEYNSFCKAGSDPIYYKDAANLLPLYGPKYYASRFCCDAFGGLGGIKINYKTEVLNKDLKPIP